MTHLNFRFLFPNLHGVLRLVQQQDEYYKMYDTTEVMNSQDHPFNLCIFVIILPPCLLYIVIKQTMTLGALFDLFYLNLPYLLIKDSTTNDNDYLV
jgi:hypothetical protein